MSLQVAIPESSAAIPMGNQEKCMPLRRRTNDATNRKIPPTKSWVSRFLLREYRRMPMPVRR